MRFRSIRCSTVAVALGAAALVGCSSPGPDHLLVITVDTLRADHLGSYGNGKNLTPNLDRLAERSVLFEDVTAPVPLTLPSHASMFTGRYPISTGVRNNGTFVVPASEQTLAEILSAEGWSTGAVVGAYPLHVRYGLGQGFDIYDDEFPPPGANADGELTLNFSERIGSDVTDRALEVWNRLGDGRRFLWVHYFDPHAPYNAPEPHGSAHSEHPYEGEVAYVDGEVGRLLSAIDLDETAVVFTSDHGESLGEHQEKTHGVFVYQSTLEIPLTIRVPGVTEDGTRSGEPVSLVDVLPTILSYLGIDSPTDLDGADLGPMLRTGEPPTRPVYAESLLPLFEFRFSDLRALRQDNLKYIEAPTPELYDLETDPGELDNLADDHPETRRLAARMAYLLEEENTEVTAQAAGVLDAEAEKNLRSLGYISGGADHTALFEGPRGRDPKDMTEYMLGIDRALGFIARGKHEEGIELLRELEPQVPENYMITFQLSGALLYTGRLDEAEETLRRVLEVAPDFSLALGMRAKVYEQQGEIEKAIEGYRASIAADPLRPEPHIQLGKLLEGEERFSEAAAEYREAVRLEPGSDQYVGTYLELRRARRDLETADRELAELIAEFPDSSALLTGRGRVLVLRHGYESDEAESLLRRALEVEPSHLMAGLLLGEILLESGRSSDALDLFQRVAKSNPDSAHALFGVGRALALSGDLSDADRAFAAVLHLDPGFSRVFTFRGKLLEDRGDLDGAMSLYRQALSLRRNDRDAREGIQRILAKQRGS